jgi:transcriptional regulator with XRE-family HTH domain
MTITRFSPERLRALRLAAGWKRPALAERADLRPATIVSYESGYTTPSAAALGRLATALRCRIDDLFESIEGAGSDAA